MNSGIELKFSTVERSDRLSFDFQDDTGVYSVSNPTGYGAPNPTSASATEARISVKPNGYTEFVIFTITLVAGTATQYTVTDVNGSESAPIIISKAFPFTSADPFNITAEDLGMGTDAQLTDGIYEIFYEVDMGAFDEDVTQFEPIVGQIECCLDSILAKVNPDCGCDDLCAIAKLVTLYESIQKSIDCDKVDNAQATIEYLTDECAKKNCTC